MPKPPAADPRLTLLVDSLDRAFRGRSWHGTALRGTLRGLTPSVALWRPAPGRNCAWDYLLHAAYWKYVVRRKLTGDARGSFPRQGANFPALPEPADARALRADLRLLEEQHALLREAVLALDPAGLERKRGSWRTVDYVMGAAAHDLYHAGQINLVKRLQAADRRVTARDGAAMAGMIPRSARPAVVLALTMLPCLTAQDWSRWGPPIADQLFPPVVTDTTRQRLTTIDALGDTWEWDGGGWRRNGGGGPPGHAVHDPVRGHTLALAGTPLAQFHWDGHRWQNATPATGPAGGGPLAFDRGRGVAVLLQTDTRTVQEWDGTTWRQVGATGAVPGLPQHAVYDGARGEVLLLTRPAPLQALDLWAWNGLTWRFRGSGGPASDLYAVAEDRLRGRIVAHGGIWSRGDTWEWDGATWTLAQASGPLQRYAHAMAFDPVRQRVLAFGGIPDQQRGWTDAWEWDGSTWLPVAPPASPPGRSNAALAHDPQRDRLVLFGGHGDAGKLDEVWEHDGQRWQRIPTTGGPAARDGAAMVHDPANGRILLFGGSDAGNGDLGDFWEWNGSAWRQLPGGPPPRRMHGMVFDVLRNRVVLHGGGLGTSTLNDTWEWDGAAWTQVTAAGPASLRPVRMAYDLFTGHTVLHQGSNGRTWTWDGTTWTAHTVNLLRNADALGMDLSVSAVIALVRSQQQAGFLETWRWNGSTWDLMTGVTPPFWSRHDSSIGCATDLRRARLWAFTGTWLWQRSNLLAAADDGAPGCGSPPPSVTAFGPPRLGDAGFRLDLRAGPGQPALLGLSLSTGAVPVAPGCQWHLGPTVALVVVTDAAGFVSAPLPIPDGPAWLGLTLHVQGAALQPNAPHGFGLGQHLRLRLGH